MVKKLRDGDELRTVQVTVKWKGVVLLSLWLKDTEPVTGDPTAVALQVKMKVVELPAAMVVALKWLAVKPALTIGGLVNKFKGCEPTLRTVMVLTSGRPTVVVPI